MKILIADDEKLVRYSLRSMLVEIGVPARSIVEAGNGEEMVETAARVTPDVAFVDIRMPRLDGLQGIERGRARSPSTRWIILTSYSSFEYAKRAIELGAAGYLLKPVSPEDLRQVLDRLKADRRREILRANEEFESRLSSLLHNTLSLGSEPLEYISGSSLRAGLLLFDSALGEKQLMERQLAACGELRARMAGVSSPRLRLGLVTTPEGGLVIAGGWPPGPGAGSAREALSGFLQSAQVALDSAGGGRVRVTMLMTDECPSFRALQKQLEWIEGATALRIALGIGGRVSIAELRAACVSGAPAAGSLALLCADLERAARAWRNHNRLDFAAAVDSARRAAAGLEGGEALRRNMARYLGCVLGARLPDRAGLPELLAWLAEQAPPVAADERSPGAGRLVEQVLAFVETAYAEDVSIARIAFRLGVTPNYLSSLFHRRQGVTFVQYVTRLRMGKAAELLRRGARVQEAARAVGYSSIRHFSRLFFRHFGRHPSRLQEEKNAPKS